MFTIVTDTSANLPYEILSKNGIPEIPFHYIIDEVVHSQHEMGEFDGKAFYDAMRSGVEVSTCQISPQQFLDVIEPELKDGRDVLVISMSSGISGSYNSLQIAAGELKEQYPERKLYTIDTRAASLGEGIVVLKAIELRNAGADIDEAYAQLSAMTDCIFQIFTVDDLKYLRRTGRISGAVAVAGTLLNIKPLLKGNERGEIVNIAKVRGRKKAISALADYYNRLVVNPEEQVVGIAHADAAEDAQALIDMLRAKHPPKEILLVDYEPVTGSHVGPGTVALFFLGNNTVRSSN